HTYIRNPVSGTHLGFQELALGTNNYGLGFKTFTNYAGIVQAVSNDPAGIGYSSFAQAKKGSTKAVSIAGSAPTAENVQKGTYPYARTLHLYTSKGHETQPALEFINFVVSPQGQQVLTET